MSAIRSKSDELRPRPYSVRFSVAALQLGITAVCAMLALVRLYGLHGAIGFLELYVVLRSLAALFKITHLGSTYIQPIGYWEALWMSLACGLLHYVVLSAQEVA